MFYRFEAVSLRAQFPEHLDTDSLRERKALPSGFGACSAAALVRER